MIECSERRRELLERAWRRHANPRAIVTPSMREVAQYGKGGGALPDLDGAYARNLGRRGGAASMRREGGRAPSASTPPPTPAPEALSAAAWWDPANDLTPDTGIGSWADQIAAYVIANSMGSEQPTTATIGSSAALAFSRAANQKLFSDILALTGDLDGTADYSITTVVQCVSALTTGNYGAAVSLGTVTPSVRSLFHGVGNLSGSFTGQGLRRATSGGIISSPTTFDLDPHVIVITHSGGVYNSWVDGAASMVAVNSGVPDLGTCVRFAIGALFYSGSWVHHLDAKLADIVLFTRILSTDDRQTMEAWHAARIA